LGLDSTAPIRVTHFALPCGYGDTGADIRIAGLSSADIVSRVVTETIDLVESIVLKGNRAVN
jgi:hypothetical protein